MKYNKTCILILEYGIPHYRKFLFQNFEKSFDQFEIIHSGERFPDEDSFSAYKGKTIKVNGDLSFTLFNPLKLLKADVIISTFNIYKPHTYIWVLLMPWKKWILWGQGIGESKFKPLIFFRKLVIKISKGYVIYTKEGKQKLMSHNIHSSKISVAGNTLSINNHQITTGSDYYVYVGRLQERKGLEKAIESCIKLDLKFIIVGDGDIKDQLEIKYAKYNNIIFKEGIYDEERLKAIFSKAIAYLSPYNVGLGVVHSFAYGVPIITSKAINIAPEFAYCNDTNSYLYENDNDLIQILKEANENKAERNKKSESAYSFFTENLSSESMIKSFEVHFNKIFNEIDHPRP